MTLQDKNFQAENKQKILLIMNKNILKIQTRLKAIERVKLYLNNIKIM